LDGHETPRRRRDGGGTDPTGSVLALRTGRLAVHRRPILRHLSGAAPGRTTPSGDGGRRDAPLAARAPARSCQGGGVWETVPMNAATDRHADRYGRPLVSRRTARVLIAVAAAVFLAAIAIRGISTGGTSVSSELISYDHIAENVVAGDFQETMDPVTEASCQIHAIDSGRATVGGVELDLPAEDSRLSAHHVEITTQGEEVSAEIIDCSPR